MHPGQPVQAVVGECPGEALRVRRVSVHTVSVGVCFMITSPVLSSGGEVRLP
jgi:hypothetical protein